jgi:hypothetical protein
MSGWLSEAGFVKMTKKQIDDAVLVEGTKGP